MSDDPGGWEAREEFLEQFYPKTGDSMITKEMIEAAKQIVLERLGSVLNFHGKPVVYSVMSGIEDIIEAALTAALSVQWIPLPPKDTWLRTRREGEDGENVCMLPSFNDEEWIERDGGRTTVTHHSFAAPTHWQHLPKETP